MIGRTDGQIDANLSVNSTRPRRFVTVLQKRQMTDLPFPKWLLRLFRPWSVSTYLLVASTAPFDRHSQSDPTFEIDDEIGLLKGKVLVFGHQRGYENHIMSRYRINGIKRTILRHARPRTAQVDEAHVESLSESIARRIRSLSRRGMQPLEVEFILFRTGELRVSAETLLNASAVQKLTPDERREFTASLIRQIYYFLKESAHNHYHHKPEQDNILPLERYSAEDDHHWRRQTLWALTRAVLEKRRSRQLQWQKRALGVLAYADAFQRNLAGSRRATGDFRRESSSRTVANYDFEHVKLSLSATHDVNDWNETSSRWRSGIFVTVALAMSAFLISLNEFSQSQKLPENWLSNTINYLASDPWSVVLGSAAIFMIAINSLSVDFAGIRKLNRYLEAAVRSAFAGLARALRSWNTGISVPLAQFFRILAVTGYLALVSWALLRTLSW